jgi:hypothetical protein
MNRQARKQHTGTFLSADLVRKQLLGHHKPKVEQHCSHHNALFVALSREVEEQLLSLATGSRRSSALLTFTEFRDSLQNAIIEHNTIAKGQNKEANEKDRS